MPFRRGASIHSMLNWGTLRPGDPTHYRDAPFSDAPHSVPDGFMREVARSGFDFVRLTVDPGPFMQLTGAARAALDATLLGDVERLRRAGLSVLVDLHPVEQVPAYDRDALAGSIGSEGFKAYRSLVAHMARVLGRLASPDVALELMNEPPGGYDRASAACWQAMLEALHAAARSEAPDLLLVLSGAQGGDLAGLELLDSVPFADSNVLYTFHYYEPHDFTHQGVAGEAGQGGYRRYLAGLPYPATRSDARSVTALITHNVAADSSLGGAAMLGVLTQAGARAAAYVRSGFDEGHIARDFDKVSLWAKAHGVPASRVLLGEFGVARHAGEEVGADPRSADAWLHDVRSQAERHGFGWAIWVLTGGGPMQIADPASTAGIDPALRAALGLRDGRVGE